ncbi:MAG: hypothetical protein FWG64_08900 [Firmicutes bacterium]|nr:hypothetical protein [Bacillota bacterium]
MVEIKKPVYMTRTEIVEKYPNYIVCVGNYKNLNETNGNDGGYPFMLIEKHELDNIQLDYANYPQYEPIHEISTFSLGGLLSVYKLKEDI